MGEPRPYKYHDPVRQALLDTLYGLQPMIPEGTDTRQDETSFANLRWMVNECIEMIDDFPVDKTGRWIGFVQGVLASRGHLSVEEERNRTRPFFHRAYERAGIKVPKSASMPRD